MIDTTCTNCPSIKLQYEYHFPHPEDYYWFCEILRVKLHFHSGVRRNALCPYGTDSIIKKEITGG